MFVCVCVREASVYWVCVREHASVVEWLIKVCRMLDKATEVRVNEALSAVCVCGWKKMNWNHPECVLYF